MGEENKESSPNPQADAQECNGQEEGNGATDIFLRDDLNNEKFNYCLSKYSGYVRDVYQHAEKARFKTIPDRLKGLGKSPFITKQELIYMDQWIQKRGSPLPLSEHKKTEARIKAIEEKVVKDVTRRAFRRYTKDPIEAMRILTKELDGVGRSRASLILSLAHPDTMPYLSRALYKWTHWDEKKGWRGWKDFRWTPKMYKDLLEQIPDLRKQYTVGGRMATAVEVEKVVFVLERESEISLDLRNPKLTYSVIANQDSIGTGNAFVYKVQGNKLGGDGDFVAVKKLSVNPIFAKNRNRFIGEVVASSYLARKSPQHFVKFLGWNEEQDRCFMAMEFVEFGDLEQNIKDNPWPERDIRITAQQILEGLGKMHYAGFAHRDLKPQNILVVCNEPGRIHVKITDFGISKRLSDRKTTLLVTNGIGTKGYKAPEVVKRWNAEEERENLDLDARYSYTFKADIWSLGCIIFKMTTEKSLFKNDGELLDQKEVGKRVEEIEPLLKQASTQLGSGGIEFVKKLIVIEEGERCDAVEALQELGKWNLA
ncbi:kinase-like protein [Daldinia sp. FL1419]|nr:kinase-like protein [Daldinia sp. FL1419]